MASENDLTRNKISTFRWLFYISSLQLLVFFVYPIFMFPPKYVLYLEILAVLTVGVIFALYFLAVNIYGLRVDKNRRKLYATMVVLTSAWIVWAAVSWLYIEHMSYLLN